MADLFVVLEGENFHSAYRTQARANAVAASDDDLTAITGAVAVPDAVSSGWKRQNNAWINPDDSIPELDKLKRALHAGHAQFFAVWYPGLEHEAPGHPDSVRALGRNLLLSGWKSVYITSIDSTVSMPLRTAKVNMMSRGASDIATPFQFYQQANALTIPATFTPGVTPVSWVVLNSTMDGFDARTLQAAINAAATDYPSVPNFRSVQFTNTGWIARVT